MSLFIATSTISDGSMKIAEGHSPARVEEARRHFLRKHGIEPDNTTLVHLTYDRTNFCEYSEVTDVLKGDGITRNASLIADGLVTMSPGHALFLPLADCIGAVIHDPAKNILMVSHLGRHNLEQHGGTASINHLVEHYDINPKDLTAWLSPAAGKTNYPLFAFNNRSLHEVAKEQLIAAGVPANNIHISPIDSSSDVNYFSHSQFLKGGRATDGRFAIVAVMK